MSDLYSGASYSCSFDVMTESVPTSSAFSVIPGERHVFEHRAENLSLYAVTKAIEAGEITAYDRQVLSQIAVFGPGCITVRNLVEQLRLRGIPVGTILSDTLERLHQFQLIGFSHCWIGNGHGPKLITLTQYGSQIAKASVQHRFNPMKTAIMEPAQAKSYAASTQLLTAFLKRHLVDRFAYRPVEVIDAEKGQIVRPSLRMDIQGEIVYCECPRRSTEYWLNELEEKMQRYVAVFGETNMTVLICGEDEDMCREIASAEWLHELPYEILFTHDHTLFSDLFMIYDYDENATKQCYAFSTKDKQLTA